MSGWNPATITAVCTGAIGIIGAVTALIAQLRHQASPQAHQETTREPGPHPDLPDCYLGARRVHRSAHLVSDSKPFQAKRTGQ